MSHHIREVSLYYYRCKYIVHQVKKLSSPFLATSVKVFQGNKHSYLWGHENCPVITANSRRDGHFHVWESSYLCQSVSDKYTSKQILKCSTHFFQKKKWVHFLDCLSMKMVYNKLFLPIQPTTLQKCEVKYSCLNKVNATVSIIL